MSSLYESTKNIKNGKRIPVDWTQYPPGECERRIKSLDELHERSVNVLEMLSNTKGPDHESS